MRKKRAALLWLWLGAQTQLNISKASYHSEVQKLQLEAQELQQRMQHMRGMTSLSEQQLLSIVERLEIAVYDLLGN